MRIRLQVSGSKLQLHVLAGGGGLASKSSPSHGVHGSSHLTECVIVPGKCRPTCQMASKSVSIYYHTCRPNRLRSKKRYDSTLIINKLTHKKWSINVLLKLNNQKVLETISLDH